MWVGSGLKVIVQRLPLRNGTHLPAHGLVLSVHKFELSRLSVGVSLFLVIGRHLMVLASVRGVDYLKNLPKLMSKVQLVLLCMLMTITQQCTCVTLQCSFNLFILYSTQCTYKLV